MNISDINLLRNEVKPMVRTTIPDILEKLEMLEKRLDSMTSPDAVEPIKKMEVKAPAERPKPKAPATKAAPKAKASAATPKAKPKAKAKANK